MDTSQSQQIPAEMIEQVLDACKAYIRIVLKLKEFSEEYARVPEILKRYTNEEIDKLTVFDIEALLSTNALPRYAFGPVEEIHLLMARSYLKTLKKLKDTPEFAKVPAVFRQITDEEIENLDAANLRAYRLMNALPAEMMPQGSIDAQKHKKLEDAVNAFCASDPVVSELMKDPNFNLEPKKRQIFMERCQMFLKAHPNLKAIQDEEIARNNKAFEQRLGIHHPPIDKTEIEPYVTHPYGTPDPTPSKNQSPFSPVTEMALKQIERMVGPFRGY